MIAVSTHLDIWDVWHTTFTLIENQSTSTWALNFRAAKTGTCYQLLHCKNGGVEVTPGCQISWCCRNTLVCERHPGVSTTHCGVHTTRRGVHTTHRGVDAPALAIKCEGQSAKCLLPDRRPPIRGTELHFDE